MALGVALSGAFSKSKSKGEQESGTPVGQRRISGGQTIANITGRNFIRQNPSKSVFGAFGESGLQGLALDTATDIPQLALAENDLTLAQNTQATGFLQDLMRSQFAKQSAGASLHGQNSIANISNLISTAGERAVKSILPQTLQLAGQNRLFNETAGQRARQISFEQLTELQKILANLTVGGSTGSQSSKSFALSGKGAGGSGITSISA